MPGQSTLELIDTRLRHLRRQSQADLVSYMGLPMPPDWSGDAVLWARIIAQARIFARCQPRSFCSPESDPIIARLFDDLCSTAEMMRRGGGVSQVHAWTHDASVRGHEDARAVRKLIALMNYLEIF